MFSTKNENNEMSRCDFNIYLLIIPNEKEKHRKNNQLTVNDVSENDCCRFLK